MASSIINSDDGVISGTSGLKSTGGDDGSLKIQTNGTNAISISSGQRSTFPTTIGVGGATPSTSGAGITFPGTVSASSDANTLDDYEEGTWTIEVYDAFTGGNQSSTTGTGYYTKIGRAVTAQVTISNLNTSGMTAGNSVFYSLPFAASADNSVRTMGAALIRSVTFPAGHTSVACYVSASNSRGIIEMSGSGINSQAIIVSNISSGTSDIYATFMYYAD